MPLSALRSATYPQIASLIAQRLADARKDTDPFAPWPEEVVVASGGLANAITRELLQRIPNGIAGLQLHTLETLARRIVNAAGEFPRVASEAERRLAMRTAVRLVDDAMLESRGIAAMLERSYRDVRDSGFTLRAFERRVHSAERSLRNARRTRTIIEVWYAYERLISRLGAIDPADLLERAAVLPKTKPQIVAGFYDMTGVQRKLIEALDPVLQFIPTVGQAPPPVVIEYETKHAELESVCDEVRALLDRGVKPDAIGITARSLDPYDARLIHRFAAARGFGTTFAEETPLIAHRIGRALVNLLRIRERGFPRAEVLELVRDGVRTKTRIDVNQADADTRRFRIAAGTAAELRLIRRNSRAVEDYISVVAELEALTELSPVEALQAPLFRYETETDLAAADEVTAVAEMFQRAKAWNIRFDNNAVIDALEQRTLVARSTGQIFLGDVMKLRGRAFEHLFLVRAQDDLFPQRRVEDPLIPDSDRRALTLREIGTGRDEEQLLFDLSAATRISYASSDGFGKILRKSRFVKPLPVTSCRLPDTRQPATGNRQLQLLAQSGTNSRFDGYIPSLTDKFKDKLQTVSPTQLEDFGECPQKFLLKHILGVVDIDDPERELQINHRDKGTIDHRILERFYRSLSVDDIVAATASLPLLPPSITSRLASLIDEAFDNLEQEAPPFNRTLRTIERNATKRILRDFVAADFADLEEKGLMPKYFEYRFGAKYAARGRVDHPEPFVIQAAGMPIKVEGSIDRIDLGIGRLRIVDYKSGKATRHQKLGEKIDRGVRLQLALYAMAASQFLEATDVGGAIKPLVLGPKASLYEFELAEKRERLVETLDLFAHAISEGRFPAFPNERDEEFNSCKYCPVNHSCRTKHEPDERYAIAQLKDPRTLLGARTSRPQSASVPLDDDSSAPGETPDTCGRDARAPEGR
jgi:RecB family exonuclease